MNYIAQAWAWLQGKKTYFLAAAGILNALATTSTPQAAFAAALPYLTAAAVRHGIATSK